MSEGKIFFGRDVVLVLSFVNPIRIVVPAAAPAPTLSSVGLSVRSIPLTTATSAPGPAAENGTFWAGETMEFIQSVSRNTCMNHSVVPDLWRPLRRLQTRMDHGGSTGPFVGELPGVDDAGVAAGW